MLEQFARIHRLFGRAALWAVWAGGCALLVSAFIVTIEVVGRKIGGTDISVLGQIISVPAFRVAGSDEITGYVFAGTTTWAYAYCLLHRSNIRIDALYNILPTGLRATLDIVALMSLLIYMGYLTWHAIDVFADSWRLDSRAPTTLNTKLWVPQVFWLTGLLFFIVTLIFLLAYVILSLFVGGPAAVQALAGTMSVQDEIEESTHGIAEIGR